MGVAYSRDPCCGTNTLLFFCKEGRGNARMLMMVRIGVVTTTI